MSNRNGVDPERREKKKKLDGVKAGGTIIGILYEEVTYFQ